MKISNKFYSFSPSFLEGFFVLMTRRVDTQIAPVDDLGADTAGFWLKRADFVAVWAVKSALYAFRLQTRKIPRKKVLFHVNPQKHFGKYLRFH